MAVAAKFHWKFIRAEENFGLPMLAEPEQPSHSYRPQGLFGPPANSGFLDSPLAGPVIGGADPLKTHCYLGPFVKNSYKQSKPRQRFAGQAAVELPATLQVIDKQRDPR